MKFCTFLSLIVIILFYSDSTFAQADSDSPEDRPDSTEIVKPLDPRNYVFISTKGRNEIKGVRWENFPRQFVDTNNKIHIDFDIAGLIEEEGFVGNISIEASLNDRKIEVAPYTAVGEEVQQVGVGSVSPMVFARALYQLIYEASESVEQFRKTDELVDSPLDIIDLVEYSAEVNRAKDSLRLAKELVTRLESDSGDTSRTIYPSNPEFRYLQIYFEKASVYSWFPFPEDSVSTDKLKVHIRQIQEGFNSFSSENFSDDAAKIKLLKRSLSSRSRNFSEFDSSITLLLKYLDLFNETDELTRMAFSKVIGRDPVFIRDFSNVLAENGNFISQENSVPLKEFESVAEVIAYQSEIISARSKVYGVCKDLEKIGAKILKQFGVSYSEQDSIPVQGAGSLNLSCYAQNETEIVEGLTEDAAKEMFKKLVRAEINLGKSGAKEGDRLSISILWFNDKQFSDDRWISGNQMKQKKSTQIKTSSAPMVLPLVTLQIKEIGWRKKIIDSFLLIRRSSVPANDPDISPSNYKGAPGISFVTSFSNDEYSISDPMGVVKALEPSIGINVSYLDFDTTKDVEIGVGAVLGLFRNRVFLGGGRNLNVKQSRPYYFLGFSFINIAGDLNK